MDNNPLPAPVAMPAPGPQPVPPGPVTSYAAASEPVPPPPAPVPPSTPAPFFGTSPDSPLPTPASPAPLPALSLPSPSPYDAPGAADSLVPQPVVQVLSPRGVEYVFLTITLLTGAVGLGSLLIALFNGKTDFGVLSFPVAVMLVSVPVFGRLFLRLKKAELTDPSLQLDASKRRSTQFIQIVTFLVSFFTLIGFITAIFAKMAGQYDGSLFALILDVIVIIGIAGGILMYYWRDEHRSA